MRQCFQVTLGWTTWVSSKSVSISTLKGRVDVESWVAVITYHQVAHMLVCLVFPIQIIPRVRIASATVPRWPHQPYSLPLF